MSKIKSIITEYKVLLRSVPAFVTSFFILATVLMNLAASKIVFNAWNVAVTGGFLLSWVPFLCMDAVCKRFGARAAILLNILSALGNVFAVIFLAIVAAIPTPGSDYTAFNATFGCVWFIVLCSTVAFVLSGVINSLLNAAIGKMFKKNPDGKLAFFTRAYISTFVGQALDNFIFMAGVYCVFAPIYWNMSLPILTCVGTAILGGFFELVVEIVFSPIGYMSSKKWAEEGIGQEYIDLRNTNVE